MSVLGEYARIEVVELVEPTLCRTFIVIDFTPRFSDFACRICSLAFYVRGCARLGCCGRGTRLGFSCLLGIGIRCKDGAADGTDYDGNGYDGKIFHIRALCS